MIVGGPHRRGASRRPRIAPAINIAQKMAPFKIGTFLRKHKMKVNNERQKQITKLPTHGMEIPDDKKNASRWDAKGSSAPTIDNKYQRPSQSAQSTCAKWNNAVSGRLLVYLEITVCLFSQEPRCPEMMMELPEATHGCSSLNF